MLPTMTAILILATLVESLVEYLIRPLLKPSSLRTERSNPPLAEDDPRENGDITWRDMALRYVAALVGIALCVLYDADLRAVPAPPCSTWSAHGHGSATSSPA